MSITINHQTNDISATSGNVTLAGATIRTGTVAVDEGGTGQTSYTDGQLLIGNSTGNTLTKATLTAGNGISITNGSGSVTIAATGGGGSGTVTSVSGTGTVSGLTLTGTVTTSGSLTLGGTLSVTASDFASQTANTFLAAPNGTAGTPTFRTIVAADIPTLNQNTTGTASNVTGTVAVANGGTGQTSYTDGQLLIGNSTGNTLTKATLTAGSGISITNGTGSVTIAATNSMVYPSAGIAVSTGSAWGTSLTAPTGTIVGTSDTQTLSNKTFSNNPTFSAGTANGVLYLNGSQVLSSTSTLTYNGTNFGIGTSSPGAKLDVVGAVDAGVVNVQITNSVGTGYTSLQFTDGVNLRGEIWAGNGSYASFGGVGSVNYSANSGPHVWYNNYTTGGERMRLTAAGNLGIGNNSPEEKLQVAGAITASGQAAANKTSAGTFDFYATDNATRILSWGSAGVAGKISFWTGNGGSGTTERVKIDGSGNVNITGLTASKAVFTDASKNLTSTGTLGVDQGGTGQTSYTDGQLLIGNSTGNTLTKATLTAGSGISITNGAGSITIAATGGGSSAWSVKSSNYTATSGDKLLADSSGGTFTITLPATPSTGTSVIIADMNDWSTTSVTVARNGSTIEGLSEDLTLNVKGASVELVYDGATWEVFASSITGAPTISTGKAIAMAMVFSGVN